MAMWTKTETAADLLRSLQRKLLESDAAGGNARRQQQDIRRDLHKLIGLLENPLFKSNLTLQESIRHLEEKLHVADLASRVDYQATSSGQGKVKERRVGSKSSNGRVEGELHHTKQSIQSDPMDPGRAMVDMAALVEQTSSSGFVARDGRTEACDKPALDELPDGRLSSRSVNELLPSQATPYFLLPASPTSRIPPILQRSADDIGYNRVGGGSQAPSTSSNNQTPSGVIRQELQYLELVLDKSSSTGFHLPPENRQNSGATSESRRPNSAGVGDSNMVLHGEWTQIQVVELENDGSGLGFGIAGGRSTGVVIKTILAGGAADRDGRLRPGDHLLQINDVHLHGMSSEQVAMILRQQDQAVVRIVVGRPADATSPHPSHSSYQDLENEGKQMDNRGSITVPTKVASDPLLLDEHLHHNAAAYADRKEQHLQQHGSEQARSSREEINAGDTKPSAQHSQATAENSKGDLSALASNTFSKENRQPNEYECFEVTLKRDPQSGLGIAVACYVHRNEEIAGLFVRNLLPGSVSAADGRVKQHDQIVKVNDNDIDEAQSHQDAIKYLAESGEIVTLTLIRYHPGSVKYRYLEMLTAQDTDRQAVDLHGPSSSVMTSPPARQSAAVHRSPDATAQDEIMKKKWNSVLGDDQEVLIALIQWSSQNTDGGAQQNFGISLEGTVDVVNGTELRPHHYIRSIHPDSAAAACGSLRSGDELLEANGRELYGKSYLEVVDILKQISSANVHLICARPKPTQRVHRAYEQPTSSFEHGAVVPRRLQPPTSLTADRLVKAKSEASLFPMGPAEASSSCDSFTTDRLLTEVATALRSRSLEPLTNLAVWSAQPTQVALIKGERGLGFSVLDYQDPLHPSDVVIVVRALVPGGVAAADGRVVPGDRLLYVDDVDLTAQASLEKAVNALKSAPKGPVRLGIAKPLPLNESVHCPIITQTERLLAKGCMSSPQPNRKWSGEKQAKNRPINGNGGQRFDQHYRSGDVYGEDIIGPQPPVPRLPPPDWTLEARRRLYPEVDVIRAQTYADYVDQHRPHPRQLYHLHCQQQPKRHSAQHPVRQTASASTVYGLPQSLTTSTLISGSYLSMSSWSGGSSPSLSPAASPSLLRGSWAADVIQLPSHLEQTAKIKKVGTDPLGITVEAVEKAINGCLVKSMLRSGAFGKDGRVRVGDFVVRMNNEQLRNVTNSQARAILKRTNLLGTTDFNVSYIPGVDAEKYREYVAKQAPSESPIPNVNRLSPKSPYVPRRQGAQSTGESDVSSDAEMSYRDGEMPLSPTASSQCGHQLASESELVGRLPSCQPQPVPHHDEVSAASSLALTSAHIDYAHYPVSGDHYVQSFYEKAAAAGHALPGSSSHELRPHTFAEALPAVDEVAETRLSPDKEAIRPTEDGDLDSRLPSTSATDAIVGASAKDTEGGENGPRTDTVPTSTTAAESDASRATPPVETTQSAKPLDSPTTSAASLGARSKYWGQPRTVELIRDPGRSLGISIVGGRVEVSKGAPGTGTTVSGIFIKSVIAQSPAGKCGLLNMGDRILSVNGVDLKEATHEQAVEVIRNAATPVRFIVQSLHSIPVHTPGSGPGSPYTKRAVSPLSSVDSSEYQQRKNQTGQSTGQTALVCGTATVEKSPTDEPVSSPVDEKPALEQSETTIQSGPSTVVEASVVVVEPRSDELSVVSEEQAVEDDEAETSERFDTFAADRPLVSGHQPLNRRPSEPVAGQGAPAAPSADRRHSTVDRPPTTPLAPFKPILPQKKPGQGGPDMETGYHRARVDSASAAMIQKADDDSEPEDEFGYTEKKMKAKYGDLKGELIMVELEKGVNGLGLSLAGHRDRSKLSVFVVGMQPDSPVASVGLVAVGDELLEINGIVLHGRSHLNASAIIKGVQDSRVKLILLRRSDAIDDMAVNPIQYNPSMQRWTSYSGVSSPSLRSVAAESVQATASSKESFAGLSSKAIVSAAMSVDLACVLNDKKLESGDKAALAVALPGRQSITSPVSPDLLSSPTVAAPRQVKVHKGPSGFGITLTDGTTSDNVRGIFITHISPDSPCAQEKVLKVGDQVLAVNGLAVNELTSSKVAEMIQDSGDVELTVNSHTVVPLPHSPASAAKKLGTLTVNEPAAVQRKASGSVSPNLFCNQIVPGYETYIEIEKAGKGLGLSIVGGTDTVLGSVVIHEVYPDGAAAKDSRLQPGDQLLEVNGQSLREVAHESAITILRQTPSKVRLLVYRDPNLQLSLLDPTQIYNIFEVELLKKPGKGLGLSIVGRKTEPGVFISEVVKGGVADADGRLMQGDQILAVNGQDLTNAMQEQAATILKTCMGKVALKVGRWKLTSGNNPNPSFPVSKILAPCGAMSPTVPAISVHQAKATLVTIEGPPSGPAGRQSSPRPSPPPSSQQPPFDIQVSTTGDGGGLTNGDQCATVLSANATSDNAPAKTKPAWPAGRVGRSTPEPLTLKEASTTDLSGPPSGSIASAVTPTDSPSSKASPSVTDDAKGSIPVLDLCEEGCDTVIVEMQKPPPDRHLGMGIGKRPRGILVTSIEPGTAAAEKLRVADRILAVNGQVVTDQQSAVNYVKSSGPRLVLQVARPRPDCVDLATGHVRSSMKQVTLQRGPEGGFGFSIDGGEAEEKGSSNSSRGGTDRQVRTPLHICSIAKSSPAACDGRLKVGDILLSVNDRSVQNATHAEAVQLIKQSSPTVTLVLVANPKHRRRNS